MWLIGLNLYIQLELDFSLFITVIQHSTAVKYTGSRLLSFSLLTATTLETNHLCDFCVAFTSVLLSVWM